MKSYCVYRHTAPSGKVYIGITSKRPQARWASGAGYVGNPYFARAIEKYGWAAIAHEVLLVGLTKEEAEAAEVRLIREHRSAEREFGYNIDLGGNAVGRASEETRAKMSASRKGHPTSDETKAKISASHKGVPATPAQLAAIHTRAVQQRGCKLPEETKAKISAALSGRERTEAHCRHIRDAKIGHLVSAATRRKISETKRSSASTARGARNAKARAILCVETGERFDTVADAARSVARPPANLSRCCAGKRRTCGGYHWKYYEEASHVDC